MEEQRVDVQFKCPCGAILSAHETAVNSTIACHQCGRILVVPAIPVATGMGANKHMELIEAESVPYQPQQTERPPLSSAAALGTRKRTCVSGLSVASLVLGIVGPFLSVLSVAAGALAIIFGGAALKALGDTPGLSGRGMAIAGTILGVLDLLLGLSIILASYASHQPEDSLDVVCFIVNRIF
jgi:hypothetical protein